MSTQTVPLDPADLDRIPPADLTACEACNGTGVVLGGIDPTSGHLLDDPCLACCGTGERGLA